MICGMQHNNIGADLFCPVFIITGGKQMNRVYQIVLSKIIDKLEAGVVPWHCPWMGGIPMNYVTKRPYSGINILLLGMLA